MTPSQPETDLAANASARPRSDRLRLRRPYLPRTHGSVLMSYLSSPADDTPEPCSRANLISISVMRSQRERALRQMDDVIRLVERQRAGDASFTGPGCGLTLNAAANALEAFLRTMDALKGEVLPAQPLPVAKPFGRRPVPDSRLPAVASPAGAM